MTEKLQEPAVRWVQVDVDRAGQRLDNFLLGLLKGAPRSLIYKLVRTGEVRVNKGRVKVSRRLQEGDLVRVPPVRLPGTRTPPPPGRALSRRLLDSPIYEDDGLLVLNKPSGLAVHGGSGVNLGLIEALRQLRPELAFLELVHRLDRDTSGCLMLAKNRDTLRQLHEALKEGRLRKRYQALVSGRWPQRLTRIDQPLARWQLASGERRMRPAEDGKASVTRFRVLNTFPGCTLVEAEPVTGRTHQIRVHAQARGHAILGDSKYGDATRNRDFEALGLRRLFLHALELELPAELVARQRPLKAPLDEELSAVLQRLQAQPGSPATTSRGP